MNEERIVSGETSQEADEIEDDLNAPEDSYYQVKLKMCPIHLIILFHLNSSQVHKY